LGVSLLVAIDPGNAKRAGRVCYAAEFRDGVLVALHTFTRETARVWRRKLAFGVDTVAIERPQQDKRRTTIKTTIGLAWNGALVASALDPEELIEMTPTEWKGGINKHPHHLQIWRRLSEAERLVIAGWVAKATPESVYQTLKAASVKRVRTGKETKHAFYDLLDAVGVGLVALDRMVRAGSHIE
jgi:hypothetical protein